MESDRTLVELAALYAFATADAGKVSSVDVANRNAISFAAAIIVMLIYHFVLRN